MFQLLQQFIGKFKHRGAYQITHIKLNKGGDVVA